ncbi:MAG: hypothetical protein ACQEWG_16020 [Bacteroidota bacterium]
MKKLIYKTAVILFGALMITSCEDNDIPQIGPEDPTLLQFANNSVVLATPEEGASAEVEAFVTTTSSSERRVEVEIDPASTAAPNQYSVSDLVIPAGSYAGTMTITGNFDAIPESGSSNLILNIIEMEGVDELIIENGSLNVEFFRRCSITLDQLVGTWSGTDSWGYPTEVETWLNDDGELMMNGLLFGWFQGWWGEIIVTNDPVKVEVDLETFQITIPEQSYLTSTYNGAPQTPYNLKASGRIVNSCERIIEINPVLIQGGSAIDGSAWGPAFQEQIQLDE